MKGRNSVAANMKILTAASLILALGLSSSAMAVLADDTSASAVSDQTASDQTASDQTASDLTTSDQSASIDLGRRVGDLAEQAPSQPMKYLSEEEVQDLNARIASYNAPGLGLLQNKSESYYYYSQLEPLAKQIYDVILQVAEDPSDPDNIGLLMTDQDPSTEEFYMQFNIAQRAVCFDHPELFWLYSASECLLAYGSDNEIMNGIRFVYIGMAEPYTDFEKDMAEFNAAADALLAEIDTSGSEYDTVLAIHDKLIDLVNYNDPVAARTAGPEKGQDLAHTAYGAFVRDSEGNPNYAVCDGYTLAFEYLCQQCGIEAAFIGGVGGNPVQEGEIVFDKTYDIDGQQYKMGGHAWNVVNVDGTWYEVDSTWDDSGSTVDDLEEGSEIYDLFMRAENDTEFRFKMDHFLFLVSSETMHHWPSDDSYIYFTEDGTRGLNLCPESGHLRVPELDEAVGGLGDSQVIALAPVAMNSYQGGVS